MNEKVAENENDHARENDPDLENGDVDHEAEIENDDPEAVTGYLANFSFLGF